MAAQPVSHSPNMTFSSTLALALVYQDLLSNLSVESKVKTATHILQDKNAASSIVYMYTSDSPLAKRAIHQVLGALMGVPASLSSQYGANMTPDIVNSANFVNDLADRIAECVKKQFPNLPPLSNEQKQLVQEIQELIENHPTEQNINQILLNIQNMHKTPQTEEII